MRVRERGRSELLLASKPDCSMRMLAIVFFCCILVPFLISSIRGFSGGVWLVYLLLLAGPAFFWQQDVMTRRIQINQPPGKITIIYTPLWSTFIPGAAYVIKRTIHLPMPRADPAVEAKARSRVDSVALDGYEVRHEGFCSVSLPTPNGGTFCVYRGDSRSTADDIVRRIRWARQELIRRGGAG